MIEENETPWPKGSLAPFGKQVIDHNQSIVAQCKTPELSLLFSQAPATLRQRDDLLKAIGPLVDVAEQLIAEHEAWHLANTIVATARAAIANVPTNHAPENQPPDKCEYCQAEPSAIQAEISGLALLPSHTISQGAISAVLDQVGATLGRLKTHPAGTPTPELLAQAQGTLRGVHETLKRWEGGGT